MYTSGLINSSKDKNRYKDFSLLFKRKPGTKQLVTVSDDQAIKQSVRNIVLYNHFEKPFDPTFGGNVIAHLFEDMTPAYLSSLEYDIRKAILNDEPRVERVIDIKFKNDLDRNGMTITITVIPKNTTNPMVIDAFIQRIR